MAYLITPRGNKEKVTPKDGVAFSIQELQDYVDGYIDVLPLGDKYIIFDVDGPEKDKLYNKIATELAYEHNPEWRRFISGNAVVCERISP